MDPLPLFRDWVMSNRLPKVENQQVLFDTISFPIDQPVPYLASKRGMVLGRPLHYFRESSLSHTYTPAKQRIFYQVLTLLQHRHIV